MIIILKTERELTVGSKVCAQYLSFGVRKYL